MNPMDLSWRLLKRQRRLSEFDPNWEDPEYGPVTEFHGTAAKNRRNIMMHGLEAQPGTWDVENDEPIEEPVVWTTDDEEMAREYAQGTASGGSVDSKRDKPYLVGVRGIGLPEPQYWAEDQPNDSTYMGRLKTIPPQRLVYDMGVE